MGDWVPSKLKYVKTEHPDGSIEWYYGNYRAFWRSVHGGWYFHAVSFSFDVWLARVDLDNEEKLMLKLRFG